MTERQKTELVDKLEKKASFGMIIDLIKGGYNSQNKQEAYFDDFEAITKTLRSVFPIFTVDGLNDDDIMYNYLMNTARLSHILKDLIQKKIILHGKKIVLEMKDFIPDEKMVGDDTILYNVLVFHLNNFKRLGLHDMDIRYLLTDRFDTISDTAPRDQILSMIDDMADRFKIVDEALL